MRFLTEIAYDVEFFIARAVKEDVHLLLGILGQRHIKIEAVFFGNRSFFCIKNFSYAGNKEYSDKPQNEEKEK